MANTGITDYNNKLYCPHDLSHADEFCDNLPTLINFNHPEESHKTEDIPAIKCLKPVLKVFDEIQRNQEVSLD